MSNKRVSQAIRQSLFVKAVEVRTRHSFPLYDILKNSYYISCCCCLFLLGVPPDIDEGPFVPIPPNITIGTKRVNVGSPVYVFSASDVIIDCNIINGTPPITILWLRNNEVVNSSVGNSSTITITDAEDGDVFTCRADNNIGFDEASSIINVQGNLMQPIHYCVATQVFSSFVNQMLSSLFT